MKIALFSTYTVPDFLKGYFKDTDGTVNAEKRNELAILLEASEWQERELTEVRYSTDVADYLRAYKDRICKHGECYYYYKPRVSKYQVPYIWIVDVDTNRPWTIYSPEYGVNTEYICYLDEKEHGYYSIIRKDR